MKNIKTVRVLAGLLLSLAAAPVLAKSEVHRAIEAQNKLLSAAVAKGDAEAIAALYTKNAEALPPNAPAVTGRKAIRKLWQEALDGGIKGLKLRTKEVDDLGNLADEEGRYTVLGADGKPLGNGKYIVIWRREDGVWRLHRDIWNSDAPVPAAK